jgi:tRNA(Ile)-lysidine synthase
LSAAVPGVPEFTKPDDTALAMHFANAIRDLPGSAKHPLAIAFSGGGDSLALLALACAHQLSRPVHALIVDHGLRANSGKEALQAADTAKALGAVPQILRWKNPKAGHNHARKARYRLLAKACDGLGVKVLSLAHTRNDQEETFVLRLERGSGARGLACMQALAPYPVWPEGRNLWLARPLLDISRKTLRQFLKQQDLRWIDDPSNQNRSYARVRIRQHLAALQSAGLAPRRLYDSIQNMALLEQKRRAAMLNVLTETLVFYPAGYAVLQLDALRQADAAMQQTVLAAVLASIAGKGEAPLPKAAIAGVAIRLFEKFTTPFSAAGCRLQPGLDTVLISRDPGAVLGRGPKRQKLRIPVRKGQSVCVDNRFEMVAPQDGVIEALGLSAKALPDEQRHALYALPAAVRPLVPVFRNPAQMLTSPVLGGAGQCRFLGPTLLERRLAPFSHTSV